MPKLTPSQTIGPFFFEAMKWAIDRTREPQFRESWSVSGRVLDGNGEPVSDALLEVWIPGSLAVIKAPLAGFQRIATDASGRFTFHLPRLPTAVVQANITLFARGLLRELYTRLYVGPAPMTASIVLPAGVPEHRRPTLIGRHSMADKHRIEWDIRLQGENETVFFALR